MKLTQTTDLPGQHEAIFHPLQPTICATLCSDQVPSESWRRKEEVREREERKENNVQTSARNLVLPFSEGIHHSSVGFMLQST